MRGLVALLTLALVCGVCKPDHHTAKHFHAVYSWSWIDYMFPDEATRIAALQDGSFNPGSAIPWGMDVDPETGRMFLSFVKTNKTGIPASLVTVSATTTANGEHFVDAYPDWSWHTKGCDGITAVEKIAIDECGRLWVMDTGAIYSTHTDTFQRPDRLCPPQLLVFDLKTNHLIKKYQFHKDIVNDDSAFSTVVVDVIHKENECKDTFVYVADAGAFTTIVYDFANDDAWAVYSNEMYPYPEFGHFNMAGVEFDYMYGMYSMALSPKEEAGGRTLYFSSLASGKQSYVKTSILQHKDNFKDYNHVSSEFKTYPHVRSGGQTGSEVMDEHGVMFFNSLNDMTMFCWNHHSEFSSEHFAEVDQDHEAFNMFADMKIVKKDGVSEVYILTNDFQMFIFGHPGTEQVHFRVMKAPIQALIEGTVCATSH